MRIFVKPHSFFSINNFKSWSPYLDKSELSPVDRIANWWQGSDSQKHKQKKSEDSQRHIRITEPCWRGTKWIIFLGHDLRKIISSFWKITYFYKLPTFLRGQISAWVICSKQIVSTFFTTEGLLGFLLTKQNLMFSNDYMTILLCMLIIHTHKSGFSCWLCHNIASNQAFVVWLFLKRLPSVC
jgi:hypothetical protein